MCGICGFIGDTVEKEQVLERMMRVIRHRGPDGSDAYFSRKAARSVMPKQASDRRKLGFPIPIRNWLREDDWYLQVKEVFASETVGVYFHGEYLLKLLEEHRTGKEDHSRKIWTVYSFLLWYQIYFGKGAFKYETEDPLRRAGRC